MIASSIRHLLGEDINKETGPQPPMGERTDACEARLAECKEAAERAVLRDIGAIPAAPEQLEDRKSFRVTDDPGQWQILAQQAAELEQKPLRRPTPASIGVNDFRLKIFFERRSN
jgi:hypothetical protein